MSVHWRLPAVVALLCLAQLCRSSGVWPGHSDSPFFSWPADPSTLSSGHWSTDSPAQSSQLPLPPQPPTAADDWLASELRLVATVGDQLLRRSARQLATGVTFADVWMALSWLQVRFLDWAADKLLTRFFIMVLNGLL